MARSFEFNNSDDVMDLRDITARFEELETELADDDGNVPTMETIGEDDDRESEIEEFGKIKDLLEELCGNGGDHDWRGDWYPLLLIRDSYMEDYARETAEDCGMIPDNLAWPCTCIDWDQATREFKQDYSTIEIDGITYWYH